MCGRRRLGKNFLTNDIGRAQMVPELRRSLSVPSQGRRAVSMENSRLREAAPTSVNVTASPALNGEQSKRPRKPSRIHPPRCVGSALDKAADRACAPPQEQQETTDCCVSTISRPP